MAGALLSTLTTGTLTGGEGGTISSTTVSNLLGAENYAIYDAMKDSITDRNYPRVYLNYLSFDESFNILPEECSITQMKGPDHVWNMLTQPGYICRKNGYVLAYVSNESDVVTFIDNTTFTIHYGQLQQEQHYYPHGLVLDAGLATGALKSNYLFEGNELQPHLNLQLSDFNYRQYDQQIGRFTSIDPLADEMGQEMFSPYHFVGNDPANYTDPLGLTGGIPCPKFEGTSHNNQGPHARAVFNSIGKFMVNIIAFVCSGVAGISMDVFNCIGDAFGLEWAGAGQPGSGNSGQAAATASFSASVSSSSSGRSATPSPGAQNSATPGASGGAANSTSNFAYRDAKAQNEANVKAYKEDMARNYGGSIGSRGSVTFDHVTYDLPAFSKWYNANNSVVPKTLAGVPFNGSTKWTNNGKKFTAFAESQASLVLRGLLWNQFVTVGNNTYSSHDLTRCEEPPIPEINVVGSIHNHLPFGTSEYVDPNYGITTFTVEQAGPSNYFGLGADDWTKAGTSKYFSVIVDDKNIYLYRYYNSKYEVHKYNRFTYTEIK